MNSRLVFQSLLGLSLFFVIPLALAESIQIQRPPALRLVVKRVKATMEEAPKIIQQSLREVIESLKSQQLSPTAPAHQFFIKREMDHYTFDVGFPIAKTAHYKPKNETFTFRTLAYPKAAVLRHLGSYQHTADIHREIIRWLKASRIKVAGPAWAVYLDDPQKVPTAQLRTDVFYPIE